MPETGGINIEVAQQLNEGRLHRSPEPSRIHEILEIVEAIVLALVACATAWSGYQAARAGIRDRANFTDAPAGCA